MADKLILWEMARSPQARREQSMFSAKTWKLLRGKMTEKNAAAWGTENGCEMQKVEGSDEERGGKYLGMDGPSPPMVSSPDYRKREGG